MYTLEHIAKMNQEIKDDPTGKKAELATFQLSFLICNQLERIAIALERGNEIMRQQGERRVFLPGEEPVGGRG
jgi:hypothetical protein